MLAPSIRLRISSGTHRSARISEAGLDRTPGYEAMLDLVDDELGQEAGDALRAPFVLGQQEQLAELLAPISTRVRIEELAGAARFASIADWVRTDVRGWTLADLVDDAAEARLLARAERDLAPFVAADGSVGFPAPALVATVTVS